MHLTIQPTHRMLLRHHPEIGHLFVPNLEARVPNELGGFYVRTNSAGFRSDVEFVPRRGTVPRILFFGDSFTAGDGVSNARRFPELVGQELGAEVFNYGLPGTGTDQHLLVLERLARNVEADLIVLAVYVENIERNIVPQRRALDRTTGRGVYVPKPFFTLHGSELSLHNVPVPMERPPIAGGDAESSSDRAAGIAYAGRRVYRNLSFLRPLVERSRENSPGFWSKFYKVSGFDPYPGYASPDSDAWRLMRAIVERFAAAVGDVPLLVVPIPESRYLEFDIQPRYQARFAEIARERSGFHLADVTTPLCALPREDRQRIPFVHDPHLSPYGNTVLATLIADEIRNRNLLPATDSPPAVHSVTLREAAPPQPTHVLGISCFYHDSAAALITDGAITAAATEERFSRVKNDRRFPHKAVNYCLEEAGIQQSDLAAVVYYDNAALTFERLLHTCAATVADGEDSFLRAMPSWLQYKLRLPELIRGYLQYDGLILQEEHHRSHLASAFLPSPFEDAAILTIDGVGEWATASIGVGRGEEIELLKELQFPHSLGLLYSAFTQFTGFKVNSGEYKMMGLAPYGRPIYVDRILEELVDLHEDGSVALRMKHFAFLSRPTMTTGCFAQLFDGPARQPDTRITQREMDISRSIQVVTEEAVLRMAHHAHELTGMKRLCMSGGVALNCVANGRLLREGPFEDVWVQPAAGDAGSALGAALDVYHSHFGHARHVRSDGRSAQGGSFLGPRFGTDEIRSFLDTHGYPYRELEAAERARVVAEQLADGKVVGHLSGRMEFGPRSLGARAILGDPRNPETQVNLNLKIKYRESFRPFAPTVLAEHVSDYFDLDRESPYMLLVAPVKEGRRLPFALDHETDDLLEQVRKPRSDVPAITHVDYSARVQTIFRDDHPAYHDVVAAFHEQTGCAVIVNTSFNVRGEPIVCTPQDAYRCFMRTEMDALMLEDFLLLKGDQPEWPEPKGHIEEHDAAPAEIVEDDLTRALREVFHRDLVPAARRLREAGALRVAAVLRPGESAWVDRGGEAVPADVFPIPAALDDPKSGPEARADAVVGSWPAGLGSDALRPVVVRLMQLAVTCPPVGDQDLEEEVSESVYVMY